MSKRDAADILQHHGPDALRNEFDRAYAAASNKQTKTETGRKLIVECAADITVKPPEWLWPGRIAVGKLTLIAGGAGLGKSQVSIAMAGTVSTAGSWPCREGRAPLGDVIFLCAEDGAADTIVPRLMATGANLRRVHKRFVECSNLSARWRTGSGWRSCR